MSTKEMPSGARRFGTLVTIAVNFALIYVTNNLLSWNVPFLTERFSECLWAINLSLSVTIFINFIFLMFDRRWFRSLMQAFGNVFGFLSVYVFWRVFPLDLPSGLASTVNLGLIIIMGLIALGTLVELVSAINIYSRNNR